MICIFCHINKKISYNAVRNRHIKGIFRTPSQSDVLHDLVPFIQFKKREKHPWRSVTFSKVAGLLKKHSSMVVFHVF